MRGTSVGAENRGIDAHVALGRKASPGWRSTRRGSLPRTAWVRSWRASRARPSTRNASGSRRRRTGGSRRCSDSDDQREAWPRRVERVLGVEHQADGDAGHVLRQVLACQRTLRGAQYPSSAYETRISCVAAFRSGISIPVSGGPDVYTRAKTPPAVARQSPSIKTSAAHAPRQVIDDSSSPASRPSRLSRSSHGRLSPPRAYPPTYSTTAVRRAAC